MADLREAMHSGATQKRDVIRLLRSALRNAEIAKGGPLSEEEELDVLAREARQRRESIEEFRKANRSDLVAKEEAELAIIQSYLPPALTREELVAAARQVIAEVQARGPGDKGTVIPRLIAQFRGRADGREINEIVTELLSGGPA